jgi:hypothetical protein
MTCISIRTLHCVEKFLSSLHQSGRLSSPSRLLSVLDKLQILSKFKYGKTDSTVRYDVVSRSDARLLRQESQFKYNRLDVCQPWSGRAHSRYWNCVFKFSRSNVHPSWSGRAKPYMEVTCSGRATVQTIVPHRPDEALKQERFSAKFSENPVAQVSVGTAQVHRPDGIHTYFSSHPFCTSAYK